MSVLSSKIYLSSFSAPVFNQLQENSCVANAVCQAVRLQSREYHQDTGELARNQIYYDYRAANPKYFYQGKSYPDNILRDSGADVSSMLAVANKVGIATQASAAPYVGTVANDNKDMITPIDKTSAVYQAPTASARASANGEKVGGYTTFYEWMRKDGIASNPLILDDTAGMQTNLNKILNEQLMHGKAVLIGADIPYWLLLMPSVSLQLQTQSQFRMDTSKGGGHAFLIVGRDDSLNSYIVENSWGSSRGDKGYYALPYNFLSEGFKVSDVAVVDQFKNVDTAWTATRANVAELYVGLLGRAVEHAGLEFWDKLQINGMSERTMAGEILKSAEATQKLGALSNAGFVNKIYTNATGHAASDSIVKSLATQLDQGVSRADVAMRLFDSLLLSKDAEHDAFANRVTVSENYGLTYQIDNTQAFAEKAIATVTSDADTVQVALTGIQHDLGWLAGGVSTFAFTG